MKRDIAIVHYNTPEITEALVGSIRKFAPECSITIFDNSDKRPFPQTDGVRILDNTHGRLVDFDAALSRYPQRIETGNNYGSVKHSMSIDYLFDVLPDGFVLMDSDVLLKQSIDVFFDESCIYAGLTDKGTKKKPVPRLVPFICWINVPLCRRHGIRYFDGARSWGLTPGELLKQYDTGASFLEDCRASGEPCKELEIGEYIVHFRAASWGKKNWDEWLREHASLYRKPILPGNRILVVIPYLASGAQGRELEYAVTGWRLHFQAPFLIVVVGDYHPIVETGDDITFIHCPQVPDVPGQYRPHLDHVRKFRMVRRLFPEEKGFIYACDDMYAVNDFGMEEILFPKIINTRMMGNPDSSNGWQRDLAKTEQLCRKEGFAAMNWVCHLPVWYDWQTLLDLYDHYDCDHNSYVVENIYFNMIYGTRKPFKLDIATDNIKCGVYRPNPNLDTIRKAFDTKIWITNSPKGWIPELDRMLNEYYFGKARN